MMSKQKTFLIVGYIGEFLYNFIYTIQAGSAVMAAAQQRHNNSKKKDNFSLFVLKKKREKLSLFFSFLLLFCLVLCRGSLRSGYMSTEIFFFSFFCRGKPNKRKRTTTKPNGCCCVLRHKLVAFPTDARDVLPLFFLFFQIL